MTTLTFVYDLFKLLYSQFSFPIVLLIFILMFKKDIHVLFKYVKSISIGNYSIEIDVSERINATYDEISSISIGRYGFEILEEPSGLGGATDQQEDTVDEFQIIHSKSYTSNYFLNNGWLDTVTALYWSYKNRIEWDQNIINSGERDLYETRDLYMEEQFASDIKKLYDLAIQYPNNKWSYEDVMKYRKMIMIAVKPIFMS